MEYCLRKQMGSASHPTTKEDDDIVHPLKKFLDKCNHWVAGSSPARGAYNKFNPNTKVLGLNLL